MTRGEIIAPLFSAVRAFVFEQTNQTSKGDQEQDTAFKYMLEGCHIATALAAANADDAAVLEIERDRIRPLTFALKKFALRDHLLFAKPFWGWCEVNASANEICFVGGPVLEREVVRLCEERNLSIVPKASAWNAG